MKAGITKTSGHDYLDADIDKIKVVGKIELPESNRKRKHREYLERLKVKVPRRHSRKGNPQNLSRLWIIGQQFFSLQCL